MRPKLLDLFCGAGGCAVGYHRAGFDVTGVDNQPMPRFPFEFVQGDALEYLAAHGGEFDVIHASPPCQRFSQAQRLQGREHADLLTPTRGLLESTGKPWVIENVPGATMRFPAEICGLALGVQVKRHRWFEASFLLLTPPCPPGHRGNWYTVFGGGAAKLKWDNGRRATAAEAKAAMGIDWMNRDELSQAIPPAYTEFIGRQLFDLIAG